MLFVFVDGLGFGAPDPTSNPVADPSLAFLRPILAAPDGPPAPGKARPVAFAGRTGFVTSADACLGVPGLPQSATGQTTLLTGVNAPAYAGRHVNAFPLGRLRALLEDRNLLTLGARAGRRVTFLNMFRPDGLKLLLEGGRRPSATTAAALAAGLRLRTVEDLLRGEAVYHDVTCWTIAGQHYGVPLVTPEEAARRALAVASGHDFTLYEYFLTDLAGHSEDEGLRSLVLGNLDRYLVALVEGLGADDGPVVLASDHGNIEDRATLRHTANPVPVLAFGRGAREAVEGVTDIGRVAERLARLAGIPGVTQAGEAAEPAPPRPGGGQAMNRRTLEVLEFDKIRRVLAEEASFGPGRDAALALEPFTDPAAVERAQSETTEARRLFDRGEAVPLGGLRDIRPLLERSTAGGVLEPAELLDIAQTCEGAARLRRFLAARAEDCPTLAGLAAGIALFPDLVAEVNRCVTDRAEVADAASPKLHQVRNSARAALARVREKLEAIVRSAEYRKALQEPIITLREGRYVVPVRSEYREAIPGVVHDRSASGVTLFVEPLSVVPLNNELRELAVQERDEVARILRELTDAVVREGPELRRTIEVLGRLDRCFAKGRLSSRLDAVAPLLVGPAGGGREALDLRRARHPLLRMEPPNKVVPIDIRLGRDFDTMVLTGPNTGGKTVTLKTVGLLTLMALAGLHIPAAEGSSVSVFRGVWADIGDEQSIEQNLSTFSAHLRAIVDIIAEVERAGGEGQLVLLDEIGAGTDPAEGAALAMALLEYFHGRGARTIATTHYSEIKAFVYGRDRMVNASVEFDVETLAPTYRLLIGVPGKSNALEISSRLGLPARIIKSARSFLRSGERDVPALIQRLEEDRARVGGELKEAREASRRAREMEEDLAKKWANLRASEEKVVQRAREEAREIVRLARVEAASVLGRLRETERRLAAAEALEPVASGRTPAGGEPAASAPMDRAPPHGPRAAEPAPLPLDSRRRLDRLEQAAREVLAKAEERARSLGREPEEDGVPAEPSRPAGGGVRPEPDTVRPGKTLYVAGLRHFGEVLEPPDEGGMVGLQVGALRLTVHLDDLRVPGRAGVPDFRRPPAGKARPARPAQAGAGTAALDRALTVSPEIHLRGLTVEEALGRLDKYLDDALLAGLGTVRVIHGRGTGVLRQAVAEYLDEHPDVRAHYVAEPAEGGPGVTVVLLGKRGPGPRD